ncbi:hypothetical protein HDV02_001058 [Globomyces sp. JEL0801]|nr:hypothetical protein HDV02_001058 [Globomyces sp. JEL0801]
MAGLGITGVTLFGLGNELFGSQHGQDLYEEASNMIMVSPTIKKHFKAYYTSQNLPGGRNLLIQEKVKRRGKNGIKIQFYLIGQGKAGICYAESYVEGDKYVIEDVHVESGGLIYKVYQREGSVRGSWFGFASDSGWWRKE